MTYSQYLFCNKYGHQKHNHICQFQCKFSEDCNDYLRWNENTLTNKSIKDYKKSSSKLKSDIHQKNKLFKSEYLIVIFCFLIIFSIMIFSVKACVEDFQRLGIF